MPKMHCMRTVLATDEMLAAKVRRGLPGAVEIYDRSRMRREGDDAVRRAATRSPCVLAIGGAAWNPMRLIRRWGLSVPTVVIVPSADSLIQHAVLELGIPFVVPADLAETAERVSASLRRAWCLRGARLAPVLVHPNQAGQKRDRPSSQSAESGPLGAQPALERQQVRLLVV